MVVKYKYLCLKALSLGVFKRLLLGAYGDRNGGVDGASCELIPMRQCHKRKHGNLPVAHALTAVGLCAVTT